MEGNQTKRSGPAVRWMLLAALALTVIAACGSSNVASTSTSSQTHGTPSSRGNATSAPSAAQSGQGTLDPAVSLPQGFPADFPIYSGARPTTQAALSSNGGTEFEVTWETLDGMDKVQAFYTAQLKQGDWTITFEASSNTGYGVTFSRKSDTKYGGILTIDNTSKPGVTEIILVLGSS